MKFSITRRDLAQLAAPPERYLAKHACAAGNAKLSLQRNDLWDARQFARDARLALRAYLETKAET